MIGAAVLSLLSRYAEEAPVAVVVDDLHALDLPSAEAVLFAARRLGPTRSPCSLTARSPEADHLVAGLPALRLGGLDDRAAAALVDPRRRAGRCRRARLDPLLALSPRATPWHCWSSPATTSTRLLDRPCRPAGAGARRADASAFARRLDLLDDAVPHRRPGGRGLRRRPAVTTRACAALGVEADALAEAEDAGLVSVRGGPGDVPAPAGAGGRVLAAPGRRSARAAHAAVAAALPEADVDRRAWHLAEAVWLPDDDGRRPAGRGGRQGGARAAYSVASGAFERAARLSPDPERRADRLLGAAEAAWSAGLTERALGLLDAHAREDPGVEGRCASSPCGALSPPAPAGCATRARCSSPRPT